ncbi:MAG: hypothetical protein HYR95_01170 [Candidatus Colwellbacteria bacterium]|nr:hypothetical protein [Candidatus Colwellbacteria bacterium]
MVDGIVRLVHFDTPLVFGVELSFLITGFAIVATLSLGILFYLNRKGNVTNRLLAVELGFYIPGAAFVRS